MRKKPIPTKLTKNKEYRTPKTMTWERTFEFYGDQRMSLSESPVRTTAGQLTKAMLNEAGARIKAKKEMK